MSTYRSIRFTCDHDGCTESATYREIALRRALRALRTIGWTTPQRARKHFCPDHSGDTGL